MEHNNITVNAFNSGGQEVLLSDTVFNFLGFLLKSVLNPTLAVASVCANVVNCIVYCKLGLSDGINQNFFILSFFDGLYALAGSIVSFCYITETILLKNGDPKGFLPNAQYVYWTAFFSYPYFQSVSMMTTAIIALVRCCCVAMPLKVKDVLTTKRQLAAIFVFSAIPISVYVYAFHEMRPSHVFDPRTNTTSLFLLGADWHVYSACRNAVLFVGFVTVIACTIVLSVSLRKSSKFRQRATFRQATKSATTPSGGQPEPDAVKTTDSRRETRIVKTVVLVCAAFMICNLNVFAYVIIFTVIDGFGVVVYKSFNLFLLSSIETFNLANMEMNLSIYYFYNSGYRTKFLEMFGITEKK